MDMNHMIEYYPETILILVLIIISLYTFMKTKCILTTTTSELPTNWPFLGMFPALLQNAHRFHDYSTEVLRRSGGTFEGRGPWFTNFDSVITSDPANVHHVLSRNFSNYPKGPEFREIFEALGDGIFNADADTWELHRKNTLALMTHPRFHQKLEKTVWRKVENGLIPFLGNCLSSSSPFDLQEIFQRFAFDSITMLLMGHDPGSLSVGLPHAACQEALINAMDAWMYRNIVPKHVWKLQKWLGVGKEKKLRESLMELDDFIYSCMKQKQEEDEDEDEDDDDKLLNDFFLKAYANHSNNSKMFLRDTFLNLIFAGRDTTSTALTWLFWLLSKNPSAEARILLEFQEKLPEGWKFFSMEESRGLVYLHGALCESLRLFPPVALEHKSPERDDVLPSGNRVGANTRLLISFYAMGRMESVWGEDCMEFKPERWISKRGGVRHEPSFKFPAFNAGPRTCVGKDMAFVQMKMVAASILRDYRVHVVEDHPVFPSPSIIIRSHHGLKVRLSRRN